MKTKALRTGMTAIEVLASTLLATLLMTALIGVLRGMKAHEKTLAVRSLRIPWQASLDAVLSADLDAAATYLWTPQSLILEGHGSRSVAGDLAWLPATIVYEIHQDRGESWLVRREQSSAGPRSSPNLVHYGASRLQIGLPTPAENDLLAPSVPPPVMSTPQPLPEALVIELWTADANESCYAYHYHRL